ncbi:AAA family ATPase [Candidatus Gracilibacteria bacterium]|nr:AAA family ATPase [Candidatus Gracilibacteria bacterium]
MEKFFGHKRQGKILEKYLENDGKNLPNAILFFGPDGIGKFETGKIFAKKILGENFLTNFYSLGDVRFEGCDEEKIPKTTNISQEDRKKRKVKTEQIGVEDIREIIKIANTSAIGGKKVFLIKNIERMTDETSNAFLKTIEEAKNSIFICTTKNENLLLPTIISRFQKIEFFKLKNEEIKKILEENNFLGNIEEATKLCFGKIDLAKKFLEDEKNFLEVKKIFDDGKNFLEEISYSKIYQKSEFLAKNKEKIPDEIFFLENFLESEGRKFFGDEKFIKVYEGFLELKRGIKGNFNVKLVFDRFYFFVA